MSPQEAATVWMAHGEPLRQQGYKTVTPAVASNTQWLRDFFPLCNCKVRIVSYYYFLRWTQQSFL